MKVGLIVIGDEILSGKRVDKHLARFIELLSERGMQLSWAKYIGDDREHIAAELKQAFDSGDLVISCGGIGATPDDHTRQAAARALGRDLVLHREARELIWQRVQQMAAEQGREVDEHHPDTLRRFEMGMFPAGAAIVPNPYNKIPGFSVGTVYFVPGFPVMAHPMMAWVLDEKHRALHRERANAELSMIVRGAMEASLTPLMEAVEAAFPGVKVFSLPSVDHPQWGRHIELGVKGDAGFMPSAYAMLKKGVIDFGASIDAEMVR
ncbi:MAG: competence/damage-inducible protein A [Paucibacter sp.]|nr:competence/damage-inducible protein A [Roseateles sp.]